MKKLIFIITIFSLIITSCRKNKCSECHHDGPNGEVEIGTFCGEELQDLENIGTITDSLGNSYVVHCGEH